MYAVRRLSRNLQASLQAPPVLMRELDWEVVVTNMVPLCISLQRDDMGDAGRQQDHCCFCWLKCERNSACACKPIALTPVAQGCWKYSKFQRADNSRASCLLQGSSVCSKPLPGPPSEAMQTCWSKFSDYHLKMVGRSAPTDVLTPSMCTC